MNSVNLRRLADYLESLPPERFDMEFYVQFEDAGLSSSPSDVILFARCDANPECGTSACIAGNVALGFPFEVSAGDSIPVARGQLYSPYFHLAASFLGLDEHEANQLFMRFDATREDAVDTLRRAAETGVIEWRLP